LLSNLLSRNFKSSVLSKNCRNVVLNKNCVILSYNLLSPLSPDGSSGARFSKVPKRFGPFSGAKMFPISLNRRGLKSSKLTFILLLVILKVRRLASQNKWMAVSQTDFFETFTEIPRNGPPAKRYIVTRKRRRSFLNSSLKSTENK